MERKQAMQIAKIWNERFNDDSKSYSSRAEVEKQSKGYYHVVIRPNEGGTGFHYTNELAAVKTLFNVSGYVYLSYDNIEPQLIGVLF